jgi:hypothetical protein
MPLKSASFDHPRMKTPSLLLLTLAGFLLTSCGSFEREWKQSVADYQSGKVASPAGPWSGTWATSTNGHTGNLRAIVSPSEKKPGEYDFRYHATWKKILSGAYIVTYPVQKSGATYRADGEEKLGIFGTFGHKATITGKQFKATYSNDKGDLGTFEMTRP